MRARGSGGLVLLAALAAAALTARLGLWQLSRAEQKLQLQAMRVERERLPPVDAAALPRDRDAAAALQGRRVTLTGAWMGDASVYLENRTMGGQAGFYVVTPLVLDDGRVAVVQRGWLPRDIRDRTHIAPHVTPTGRVSLAGHLATTPSRVYQLGEAGTGPIRQNLELDAYARELRRPLLPLVVVQDEAPAAADGLRRDWPQPASDVHKHHGYAFQWFGLSALVVILYVWFQLIRPRRAARP